MGSKIREGEGNYHKALGGRGCGGGGGEAELERAIVPPVPVCEEASFLLVRVPFGFSLLFHGACTWCGGLLFCPPFGVPSARVCWHVLAQWGASNTKSADTGPVMMTDNRSFSC